MDLSSAITRCTTSPSISAADFANEALALEVPAGVAEGPSIVEVLPRGADSIEGGGAVELEVPVVLLSADEQAPVTERAATEQASTATTDR